MTMMTSILGIRFLFVVFMALVPIALLVVLQVWLCRKEKWLGLILPGLSLLLSLLLVFSLAVFTVGSTGSTRIDSNGQVLEEYHEQTNHTELTPGAMGAIAGLFLVSNIPTVVFGGIWLHYKNRRDFQEDLKKMKIEDLE
ncbi:MAG: hypothetical protein VB071_10235 [Lawsonibacter sp.]|nr:hypothetical protein [Lawsonibacter sp.]